jgi:hypothetical protein
LTGAPIRPDFSDPPGTADFPSTSFDTELELLEDKRGLGLSAPGGAVDFPFVSFDAEIGLLEDKRRLGLSAPGRAVDFPFVSFDAEIGLLEDKRRLGVSAPGDFPPTSADFIASVEKVHVINNRGKSWQAAFILPSIL